MFEKAKKMVAFGLTAGLLATTLVGCGSSTSSSSSTSSATAKHQDITLTLWGSQDDQAMLQTLSDNFVKTHKDNNYTIKLGVCGQDVAQTTVLKDVDAAADVFGFASDQLVPLESAGALLPITIDTASIKKNNTSASVQSATVGKQLYAYPMQANTYFLYYNKKYLQDSDVTSLESILSKSLPSGVTNFAYPVSNGWYNASFFMTAGCKLFGSKGTDSTKCDFNSSNGVTAGKYMINLASQTNKFVDYGTNYDTLFVQAFQSGKLAAAVDGTWNATKVKEALGSDYGAAKLPTIKLNGKAKQMVSFSNFNLYGVNAHTKHALAAMELAEYISSYDGQKAAFEQRDSTPTNIKLTANKSLLKSNIATQACAEQTQHSVLQPSIDQISNFWTPMQDFGSSIEQGKTTVSTLKSDLDSVVKQILSKVTSSS